MRTEISCGPKDLLVFTFSTNTNCESMACLSSRSEECSARGYPKNDHKNNWVVTLPLDPSMSALPYH